MPDRLQIQGGLAQSEPALRFTEPIRGGRPDASGHPADPGHISVTA